MLKNYCCSLLLACVIFPGMAQQTPKPVSIEGKFTASPADTIRLFNADGLGMFEDSIFLAKDGSFHYSTNDIRRPMTVRLQVGKRMAFQLFLAPGYHIGFQANLSSSDSLYHSWRMTGVGASCNQLSRMAHKPAAPGTVFAYNLPPEEFVGVLLSSRDTMQARIANARNKDPYRNYFEQVSKLDNYYQGIASLLTYAGSKELGRSEVISLADKLYPKGFLDNFQQDEHLCSSVYANLVSNYYPMWLYGIAAQSDSPVMKEKNPLLHIINGHLTGASKEYALFSRMSMNLGYANSMDQIEDFRNFNKQITNPAFNSRITSLADKRAASILRYSKGSPFPKLSFVDENDQSVSLGQYRGKIVLIDCWASWCGPCKTALPALKKVYEYFKPNSNVVVLGMAVLDKAGKAKRQELTRKEGYEWAQWEDRDGSLAAYFEINAIPRYLLIGKDGAIIDADAPGPHEYGQLIDMIERMDRPEQLLPGK